MPNKIVLLRHAEQPEDSANADLSGAGCKRASKLAPYICKEFGTPDAVFAAAPTGASVRSYLTMRPLAKALSMPIRASFKSTEFAALASRCLMDPAFKKGFLVICWTHNELPSLAACLGVAAADFPVEWDDAVFDAIFEIVYRNGKRPKTRARRQPF